MDLKVIDLFAGSGGLSLGLEESGFRPVFVSELNKDAMATYLLNRPNSNLQESRNHAFDIKQLTKDKQASTEFSRSIQLESGEIDLVCGGPPCQGFSGIGHRRTFNLAKDQVPTNHLYKDFAKVVQSVAPKAFLFENVRGLLTSKWTPEGNKGEIWEDVKRAFAAITVNIHGKTLQYEIGWRLVYAKDFGVPQNRPRVILVGLREDIPFNSTDSTDKGLLPEGGIQGPDLIDLLSDLIDPNWKSVGTTSKYLLEPQTAVQEALRHAHLGRNFGIGDPVADQQYSKHSDAVTEKFEALLKTKKIPEHLKTRKFAQRLLPPRWGENGPSITATSLPDDYVHFSQPRILTVREWARLQTFPDWYEFSGPRTTGGRRRAGDPSSANWDRALPKYTQIGNAVPVQLGRHLGAHIASLF
jgi:DNA (cytosine-5)-methyltransferase 1